MSDISHPPPAVQIQMESVGYIVISKVRDFGQIRPNVMPVFNIVICS